MRLLVDAQLPNRLVEVPDSLGHDAVHTSALPRGNRTTDAEITRIADDEGRVVVSKDRDFRDGHLLGNGPARLLLVTTGNIRNTDLIGLFVESTAMIEAAFASSDYVELTVSAVIGH